MEGVGLADTFHPVSISFLYPRYPLFPVTCLVEQPISLCIVCNGRLCNGEKGLRREFLLYTSSLVSSRTRRESPANVVTTARAHQNLPLVSREPRILIRGFCHRHEVHERFEGDHAERDAEAVHKDAPNAVASKQVQPLIGQEVDQLLSAVATHRNGLLSLSLSEKMDSTELVRQLNAFLCAIG